MPDERLRIGQAQPRQASIPRRGQVAIEGVGPDRIAVVGPLEDHALEPGLDMGRRSAAPNHDAAPWWASCNRCRRTTTQAAPTTICEREGQQCFDEPESGAELTQ
jgi:hypothetical protein